MIQGTADPWGWCPWCMTIYSQMLGEFDLEDLDVCESEPDCACSGRGVQELQEFLED